MKWKTLMFAMVVALTTVARGATNDLTDLLQKGLFEEEANRDLSAAIANYQSLATAFDKDRQLAATAVFRLGECYRKLGKTNEAVIQYQRIIKEFGDQPTLVTLSRQNLTGLDATTAIATPGATTSSLLDAEANVASLQAQIQAMEKMPHDQQRIYAEQNFANLPLTELASELDLAQQNLIKLKVDYTPDHPKYKAAQEVVDDLNRKVDAQVSGVLEGLKAKLSAAEAMVAVLRKPEVAVASSQSNQQSDNRAQLTGQINRLMNQITNDRGSLEELLTKYVPTSPFVVEVKKRIDSETAELSALTGKLQAAPAGYAESESPITDEEQQEIKRIQVMIQNSPDLINAPGGDGKTPLLVAAEKGQLVVAKYLLDHGANVDAISGNHVDAPLSSAARNGHKAMVELLLAHGADVNGHGALNPLYEAVQKGYVAVAEVLLANKADVNSHYNGGPVVAAVENGQTELLKLLVQHGADVNARNLASWTPLEIAAQKNDTNAAKLLLDAKANIEAKDHSGNTALHEAAQAGKTEMVSLLLESGAMVDATNNAGTTPLLLAVANDRTGAARVLLQHKADPNREGLGPDPFNQNLSKGTLPLFFAIWKGNDDIVKLLLDAGADPEKTSHNQVPLYVAIDHNRVGAVQMLLEHGADPNRVVSGLRPLNYTLRSKKDNRIAHLLLDKGADPNADDSQGGPPLFCTSDPEVGRWLVEHKADVNGRAKSMTTPLMSMEASPDYEKFLLEAGAKPDLQDTNGNTALHHAVYYSSLDTVSVLLDHKANPNIQNDAGYTPLDLAKSGTSGQIAGHMWMANWGNVGTDPGSEKKIVDLLTGAGGLANLPKRNLIEVRRASGTGNGVVFIKDSHDWNRYSLLEMIAGEYRLISQNTSGEWSYLNGACSSLWDRYFHFPDFKKVIVYRRAKGSAKQKAINVDVEDIINKNDCSRDMWLEWGDVVEIPEADHPVDQRWPGLSAQTVTALTNCLARTVTIIVKGESTQMKLAPEVLTLGKVLLGVEPEDNLHLTTASFMLRSVLDNSKLIRVSSDLSRVKVTRIDPETKKKQEWTIDCTNPSQADFWVRDGDVIEVPER